MSKAILRSIHPEYCQMIAAGRKTKEVRKTIPKKIEFPYKVYIYCTQGNKMLIMNRRNGVISLIQSKAFQKAIDFQKHQILKGKVIGEYICSEITEVRPLIYPFSTEGTCLTAKQIFDYAGDKQIYFEHISELVIYDKPKELSEFKNNNSVFNIDTDGSIVLKGLCRPPQSWCYVEALD